MRFIPEKQLAFALLTNCDRSDVLRQVNDDVLNQLLGIGSTMPDIIASAQPCESFCGVYDSLGYRVYVKQHGNKLSAKICSKIGEQLTQSMRLAPLSDSAFLGIAGDGELLTTFVFLEQEGQMFHYLFLDGRMLVNQAEKPPAIKTIAAIIKPLSSSPVLLS